MMVLHLRAVWGARSTPARSVVRSRCSQSLVMQSVAKGVTCVHCVVLHCRVPARILSYYLIVSATFWLSYLSRGGNQPTERAL